FERRGAVGLQAHAVGAGAPKTEQSRGQRVEVDRVDVARDGGVAATGACRYPPDGGWWQPPTPTLPHKGGGGSGVGGGRLRWRALAAQVGAGFRPDGCTSNRRLERHVELPAAWMWAKVGCANPQRQP